MARQKVNSIKSEIELPMHFARGLPNGIPPDRAVRLHSQMYNIILTSKKGVILMKMQKPDIKATKS